MLAKSLIALLVSSALLSTLFAEVIQENELRAIQDSFFKRDAEAEPAPVAQEFEELEARADATTFTLTDIVTVTSSTDVVISFTGPFSTCPTSSLAYHSS